MNYDEALEYIHGTMRFGSKLGLQNIANLLELMGNPHKQLKYIHIAGTNGKGSTTAMITRILQEQGYRVGMYTSPYIEDFRERIQINGEYITKEALASLTGRIKEFVQIMVDKGLNHPTEFEIITALAFQYYFEQKCDYVVLEVGMGGRFDATNIIDCPLVSVITAISMDHMEYLGNTLDKIAFEKCGIIKENGIVVVYPEQAPEVMEVIRNVSQQRHAEVLKADCSEVFHLSDSLQGIEFSYKQYKNLRLSIIGRHQVLNAVTAITAIEALREYHGVAVSKDSIMKGLSKVQWPGRLEVLSQNPLFIIDGAHNFAGIQALKSFIDNYIKDRRIILVIGMLADKEYEKSVAEIAPTAHSVVATMPVSSRALDGNELGKVASKYCKNVVVENDYKKAVMLAMQNMKDGEAVLCCGSLYLVGYVRKFYKSFSQ